MQAVAPQIPQRQLGCLILQCCARSLSNLTKPEPGGCRQHTGARRRPRRCIGWLGVPRSHTHQFSDIPCIKCKAVGHFTLMTLPKEGATDTCSVSSLTSQLRHVPASLSCLGQLPAQIRMAGVTELSSATSFGRVISEPWLNHGSP